LVYDTSQPHSPDCIQMQALELKDKESATSRDEKGRGACHFGPLPSLPWPLGHVRLISP